MGLANYLSIYYGAFILSRISASRHDAFWMAVVSDRKAESGGQSCIGNSVHPISRRRVTKRKRLGGQSLRRTALGVQASASSLSGFHGDGLL